MSEEIKVGDWVEVKTQRGAQVIYPVRYVGDDYVSVYDCDNEGINYGIEDCKKVYVSDTPPSKTVGLISVPSYNLENITLKVNIDGTGIYSTKHTIRKTQKKPDR